MQMQGKNNHTTSTRNTQGPTIPLPVSNPVYFPTPRDPPSWEMLPPWMTSSSSWANCRIQLTQGLLRLRPPFQHAHSALWPLHLLALQRLPQPQTPCRSPCPHL